MKPTQLREFLYSEAEWNNYWGLLAQLYSRLRAFQNLYQGLVAEVSGKTLGSIVGDKEKEHLQRILLGGYDAKNMKYSRRALGRFYRDILGIGVNDEQLVKFATRLREGDIPADAGQEIPIAVGETEVLKTLNEMTSVLQEILYVKSNVEVVEEAKSYDVRGSSFGPRGTGRDTYTFTAPIATLQPGDIHNNTELCLNTSLLPAARLRHQVQANRR